MDRSIVYTLTSSHGMRVTASSGIRFRSKTGTTAELPPALVAPYPVGILPGWRRLVCRSPCLVNTDTFQTAYLLSWRASRLAW